MIERPNYGFLVGAAGAGAVGAGVTGVEDCGAGFGVTVLGSAAGFAAGLLNCCRIDPPFSAALSVRKTSAIAQTMNITAHHVVALERMLAAPRGPNAV